MSIRSHSQSSMTFVTVYGFLGKRLHTGRCNVYEFFFSSHDLIERLDFAYVPAASFLTFEKAER